MSNSIRDASTVARPSRKRRSRQPLQDQSPHVRIIRLTNMSRNVIRIVRLDIHITDARFVDKRCRRRGDQFVLARDDYCHVVTWLDDRIPVV